MAIELTSLIATDFIGATGPGMSVTNDTANDVTYYPAMYSVTSGIPGAVYVANSKLYFNPSTGSLNSTTFNSLSDENYKINIHPIENALDIIEGIRGVKFEWKDTGAESAGLIAQDVEKYMPELINNQNDIKSLNYNGIIGVLVEAIKDLSNQVKELQSQINDNT